MKKFNQNHLDWSAEKKERKVKKHGSDEACKCFAPFLKLHWHDCPMVNKPCPIHGNHFDCTVKEEKEEHEQNVTISFYPSSKTERLFQPVKSLLAQCNPETKINLQYFSPRDFPSKSTFKHQLIQTSSEDLKTALNNNFFVEKSKSFTTDKTNKMKKLKQCFHSPCNSIAKKSRSQVSFREKMNEIFRDESQHRSAFFNMNLEEPREDVKNGSSFGWFTPSKMGLENFEKLSDEKKDSDFITFTQRSKNNVINHKIFEIKHKKGLNDISKVKIYKEPTQFVYTSFASKTSVKEATDPYPGKKNEKVFDQKQSEKDVRRKDKHETSSVSANSTSSGSVYVTPFFLMPTRLEDSDSDPPKTKKTEEFLQSKGSPTEKEQCMCSKDTQTGFPQKVQKEVRTEELKTISLQTEPSVEEKHSQCTKEIFLHDYEPSMETVNEKLDDDMMKVSGEDLSDDGCWRKKCYEIIKEKKESSKYTKTIEVQTSNNYRYKEVCVSTRCDRSIRDQMSQTETIISETRRKVFEPTPNKCQVCHMTNKEIQTEFSDHGTGSDASKVNDLESSESIRCSDELELVSSEPTRSWGRKSISDSELYDKKKYGGLKGDYPNLSQNCCCKCSNVTHGSSGKDYGLPNTSTKVFDTCPRSYERGTNKFDNVAPPKQPAVEHVSKAEQTSLVEDDCADLSELKKIIQEFFEKRDPNSGKKLDEDTLRTGKTDCGTMTESFMHCHRPSQDLKNAVDVETQTTVHVLMDDAMEENHTKMRGQRVKFRQSVLLDDENQTKTFFICALCGREINKFSVNASTNTENLPNHVRVKEKTTVVDTEVNEVITVKTLKKTQNIDSTTSNSKSVPKQIMHPSPDNSAKALKTSQNPPRAINFQRSCIPILISGPGSAHLRYDETITVCESSPQNAENLDERVTIPAVRSKLQNQRSPESSPQCICNDLPGPSENRASKTSSPMSMKASKTKESKPRQQTGIFPSLPRVEHPGVQNSQWRNERTERGSQRKTDGYFYPVIINSFWPREFIKTWESMEKYDNRLSISTNQKRSYEKGVEKEPSDIPAEKKIRPFFEESPKECFVFGKSSISNLFKKEKQKTSLGKNTGFIWVPSSSVPQMSSGSSILNQFKTTKSEELLKISQHQGSSAQVEKFAPNNQSEIFTVKSCHLKPVTFKQEEQSFSRLLECSFCKSFTFLKAEKKDEKDEAWSKGKVTAYQTKTPEKNPNEWVPEEPPHDSPLQYDEEFLRECSLFSDDNDVPESLENNVSEDEIAEVFEETYSDSDFQRPKLQSQSQIEHAFENPLNFDMATTSKSLNTFWFDGVPKKNFTGKSFK